MQCMVSKFVDLFCGHICRAVQVKPAAPFPAPVPAQSMCERLNVPCAVVVLPKSIDNDLLLVGRCAGNGVCLRAAAGPWGQRPCLSQAAPEQSTPSGAQGESSEALPSHPSPPPPAFGSWTSALGTRLQWRRRRRRCWLPRYGAGAGARPFRQRARHACSPVVASRMLWNWAACSSNCCPSRSH